jgi:hypothetical protein
VRNGSNARKNDRRTVGGEVGMHQHQAVEILQATGRETKQHIGQGGGRKTQAHGINGATIGGWARPRESAAG